MGALSPQLLSPLSVISLSGQDMSAFPSRANPNQDSDRTWKTGESKKMNNTALEGGTVRICELGIHGTERTAGLLSGEGLGALCIWDGTPMLRHDDPDGKGTNSWEEQGGMRRAGDEKGLACVMCVCQLPAINAIIMSCKRAKQGRHGTNVGSGVFD